MKRNSLVAVALACLMLVLALVLLVRPFDRRAPSLTVAAMDELLRSGDGYLRHRDTDGLMSLTVPGSRILGKRPEQTRMLLARAMRDVGPGGAELKWQGLAVAREGDGYQVSAEVQVVERGGTAQTTFYSGRVIFRMERVRYSRWLGLAEVEEWRIRDMSLAVPPLFSDL